MTDDTGPLPTAAPAPDPDGPDRRWWYVGGVVLLAALVGLGALLLRDDDDALTATPVAGPSPTATATTTPTPSPTTTDEPDPGGSDGVDRSSAVWPVTGSGTRYTDPVAAARGFATDFLGFAAPVVGAFRQGDSRSGEVEVRPRANGPVTTVLVRQLSGEDTWSVLGATTEGIALTEPEAGQVLRSPATLRGSALAFEGTVQVHVREDGRREPLGRGFVTGGGDQMRPFEGTVEFSRPSRDLGALVLFTESAENGEVWAAAVLRVRLSTTAAAQPAGCGAVPTGRPQVPSGSMEVDVFFSCDPQQQGETTPFRVHRVAPQSPAVLRASLTALLAGPTAEETAGGLASWFSAETAGLLRGVTLTDGHAVVDFRDLRPVVPNASTSAGSALLLSQLDATVFQFPSVRTAEYRIDGSCSAFTEWVQAGGCAPRTR